VSTVFAKEYPLTYGCNLGPVDYGGGRRGFVASFGWKANGLELFAEVPSESETHFQSLLFHHLGSSVGTVASHDWNGDGQDDVLFGWSGWRGFCPALVILEDARPGPVVRLTEEDWVGNTEIAISNLDTGSPHLIAATAKSRDGDGAVIEGYGLRVWRLGSEEKDRVHFERGDFVRVAAGDISGREVFATARRETLTESPLTQNLILEAFHMQRGKIERVWQTKLFNTTVFDPRLSFADVNGDGTQELVVTLERSGVYIFALAG
jgi:hypothetical protein